MFARFFLIIGGLNYLYLAITNTNTSIINENTMISGLIGLSALILFLRRDYYLPFLGNTVMVIPNNKISENSIKVTLSGLPPNVNVVYWASKSDENVFANFTQAYGDLSNSGTKRTDDNGNIIIDIECPSEYNIKKFGIVQKKLKKHVHYRYELSPGMFSRVYTKYITTEC